MHGGHRAVRVVGAVALLALPLIGLTVLASAGGPALPDPSRDAVLRLAPGQGGEASIVRSGEAENGTRRGPAFLAAALVAAVAAIALVRSGGAPELRPAPVHRGLPLGPTSRAPPVRFRR